MNTGRYISRLFIVLLLLVSSSAYAMTSDIKLTAIAVKADNDKTRIIFNLTSTTTYKALTLTAPDRIVIDFSNTQLATSLTTVDLSNSPITHIRQGQPKPHTLRIVLDLSKKLPVQTEMQAGKLVIDIFGTTTVLKTQTALQQTSTWAAENLPQDEQTTTPTTAALTTATPADILEGKTEPVTTKSTESGTSAVTYPIAETIPATSPTIEKATKADTTIKLNKAMTETVLPANEAEKLAAPVTSVANIKGERTIIIVIDPGHGGKDPGTAGTMGVREKDVVLAISKQVQEILNKESGFRGVLTRDSDYFIPLRQRLSIARKDKGDMFVAIHADAYINSYAGGSSVFTLSAHGASSEAARWLAEKENYSELGGVTLNDKSHLLRSVLIDLSQTATIASSLQVGKSILRQLGKVGKLHRGFVEQAPFMVLKNPDIPSLLVETGFLSNPLEEQRLRDPYYQRQLASAIVDGIKDYFWSNPPPGTLIARLKQSKSF